jgi:acetoin utilization deacetylase AcuC-like enzyme
MTAAVYLRHPSSLEHDTGPHPERAARIPAIEAALAERDWLGMDLAEAPAADRGAIEAVHDSAHLEQLEAFAARGGGAVDADTIVSRGSWDAALHAAGGACELVDRLLSDAGPAVGFSGLRPPGHHALPGRAMGFCLVNNVAVAAQRALDVHGLERVLILDWDVHHGNGTNDIFHSTDAVLFASIHESPLYPGTGPVSDRGSGAGEGFTINLPVPGGSGDETFTSLVEEVVAPRALEYRPQLILVSAGYDAHRDDPLATCEVTEVGYAAMATAMRDVARSLGVPIGLVLEGGYDVDALARSVVATLEALTA